MSQPFLSEIRICSFNFAPKNWALCNGQLLAINSNQALFRAARHYVRPVTAASTSLCRICGDACRSAWAQGSPWGSAAARRAIR